MLTGFKATKMRRIIALTLVSQDASAAWDKQALA